MSASPEQRAPLELVTDPTQAAGDTDWLTNDSAEDVPDVEPWQAETVFTRWEAEHQLIGALMWLTAEQAKPILELVPDGAIWRPTIRWAYQLIRKLVEEGRNPDPVVVLATAKHQPCSEAVRPEQPPTPVRHHKLAVYLAAAYTQVLSPVAAAGDYTRSVLDEAYRRAFRDNGLRMLQLAECGPERGALAEQFGAIRDELAELWQRAEIAAKPGWWQA